MNSFPIRSLVRWASSVLLALFAVFTGPAAGALTARPAKVVLVLKLEGDGLKEGLSEKLEEILRHEVASVLKPSEMPPAPALGFEAMRVAAGCRDEGPACLASIGNTLGVTHIIRTTISNRAGKAQLELTSVRVKDKKATRKASVEIEALDESALEEFRWHVASALGEKRPPPPGSIAVSIKSDNATLEGTELFFDDKKVPIAALKSVVPGDHRIELHHPGTRPFFWAGLVRPGRETWVEVTFEPQAWVPPAPALAAPETVPVASPEVARSEPEPAGKMPSTQEPPQPETPLKTELATPPAREPRFLLTWIFAGASVASAAVGAYFGFDVLSVESDLEDLKTMKMFPCKDDPNADICRRGRRSQNATFIAFPLAGAFAVGAIAAFIIEDGMTLFDPHPPSGAGRTAISGTIVPFEGGFTAGFVGRY